jgi:hypothetical protein
MDDSVRPSGTLDIDQEAFTHTIETVASILLISTPKEMLVTCNENETIGTAIARGQGQDFDYLPVERTGRIVGLFNRRKYLNGESEHKKKILRRYQPLNVGILISSDASILDFIATADLLNSPCRLVIRGTDIAGLVSASDLQKLPVQTALFALVMHFEALITQTLRQRADSNESLLVPLVAEDRKKARKLWERRVRESLAIDMVSVLALRSKIKVLRNLYSGLFDRSEWDRTDSIIEMRNGLAHGLEYASTWRLVSELVTNVNTIRRMIARFDEAAARK